MRIEMRRVPEPLATVIRGGYSTVFVAYKDLIGSKKASSKLLLTSEATTLPTFNQHLTACANFTEHLRIKLAVLL